jgi:CRP-like cAMP-binding protein
MSKGSLGPGDTIGEDALLSQGPHKFDVVALGAVTALVISRTSFDQLCGALGAATSSEDAKELASLAERLTIEGKNDKKIGIHFAQNQQ